MGKMTPWRSCVAVSSGEGEAISSSKPAMSWMSAVMATLLLPSAATWSVTFVAYLLMISDPLGLALEPAIDVDDCVSNDDLRHAESPSGHPRGLGGMPTLQRVQSAPVTGTVAMSHFGAPGGRERIQNALYAAQRSLQRPPGLPRSERTCRYSGHPIMPMTGGGLAFSST